MYKAKLWDEDKWNIHEKSSYSSSKYGSIFSEGKKEDKKYHEQKYGSEGKDVSSDYMRKEDTKEKEEKKDNLFEEEEQKKEKGEIKEEEIPFKAAKQIFAEHQKEGKKDSGKKDIDSIEEAIKKAIEEEKKVIMMD